MYRLGSPSASCVIFVLSRVIQDRRQWSASDQTRSSIQHKSLSFSVFYVRFVVFFLSLSCFISSYLSSFLHPFYCIFSTVYFYLPLSVTPLCFLFALLPSLCWCYSPSVSYCTSASGKTVRLSPRFRPADREDRRGPAACCRVLKNKAFPR